jgi:murein DD-endopeptidase MepM/ murein hydrolase activator NlpD
VLVVLRWLVAVTAFGLLLAPLPVMAAPAQPAASGWPLPGDGQVLRPFDPPETPYGPGNRGVDLEASVGSTVLATAAGRVVFAGMVAGRGVMVVSHGSLRTTYEPVTARLPVGAEVKAGEVIGVLAAGTRCGPRSCLHWGLLRGKTYLNPLTLVSGSDLTFQGPVRLLPASSRAVATRRAAQRVLAARLAGARQGPAGRHGFARPVAGAVTSGFGRRLHPVRKVWKLHDGTDFGAPCGTPIRAPYAGTVTRAFANAGYGRRLFLDHGQVDGRRVVTSYNHAERYVVGVGSRVTRGQVLGYVGSTGLSTGCHLHLMVWLDNGLTDPLSWL